MATSAATTTDPNTFTWSPPIYNLSTKPELGRVYAIQDDDGNTNENFARNVRWTPDGSVFMTNCENQTLQLFTTTTQRTAFRNHKYDNFTPNAGISDDADANTTITTTTSDTNRNIIKPSLILRQPSPILDFTWFPGASPSTDPTSFCFLASIRECPVKLIDASDGRLRASYKIIDHRERFVAPHCMSFNLDASRIYCGHESAIEIFDMSRPGEGTRIHTSPSRKSKDGLKGIISALSFSPNYTSSNDAFYAVGTLNTALSNLAIYTESQPDVPMMFVGGGERAGVTQLRFNPIYPHILYAAYRRRGFVLAWDLRSDVNVPFAKYVVPTDDHNMIKTNQKMGFDVDVAGQRLAIGNQKGNVHVFNLSIPPSPDDDDHHQTNANVNVEEDGETVIKYPDLTLSNAHSDSVGGVAFHPYEPVLLSVSGSRHYNDDDDDDDAIESEDEEDDGETEEEVEKENEGNVAESGMNVKIRRKRPVAMDCSIKEWYFR